MKFEKYYNDIKNFPKQFVKGFELAKKVQLPEKYLKGNFNKIVLCGMGGSSLPGDLINNILAKEPAAKIHLEISRSYDIPIKSDKQTFFIVCSYSGGTEETLACYEKILEKEFYHVVIASGGKLIELAKSRKSPFFLIPTGLQPRLSTGYIISVMIYLLEKMGLVPSLSDKFLKASLRFVNSVDEKKCVEVAKRIKGKVPIIYAEEENYSIARIGKIKMNENAKTQSFWNFFPELNHNEMVGFSNLAMNPFFLIFESKYTNSRNHKRIQVFSEIMRQKKIDLEVVEFKSENFIEESLASYYYLDLVSYYLACEYEVDPEPVDMVEEFKKKLITHNL